MRGDKQYLPQSQGLKRDFLKEMRWVSDRGAIEAI